MRRARTHPKHVQREVTRHGRTNYYYREGQGQRVRLSGEYLSHEFWESYALAVSGLPSSRDEREKHRRFLQVKAAIRSGLMAARHRAAKRLLPFDLTEEWALAQIEMQSFRCALTGIPFFTEPDAEMRVHPYAPSFDRIAGRNGYTTDNVRIVVSAVNLMLLDWGEAVFNRVAEGYRSVRSRPI